MSGEYDKCGEHPLDCSCTFPVSSIDIKLDRIEERLYKLHESLEKMQAELNERLRIIECKVNRVR